jgi:hypothetical protein
MSALTVVLHMNVALWCGNRNARAGSTIGECC